MPAHADPPRLRSLDALRGFDMFWIAGGATLVAALADTLAWRPLIWLDGQLEHVPWHGFSLWDLVFPLFLFLAGVSLPLSLAKRRARGDTSFQLHAHCIRRGLVLVGLGVLYNAARTDLDLRYASVLGRIGLAWCGAALIALHAGPRGQWFWSVGLLLGYWAALSWVPVPGIGAGHLEPGATLTDWVDRQLLPGRLHRTVRDPEGILGTLSAIATALLGAAAGRWLTEGGRGAFARLAGLLGAGAAGVALGWLWDAVFPINKNLWSSSFVLWCAGWSAILLALFHLVIDVLGWRRWAHPFVVLGANAITIYLLQRFVPFERIAAGMTDWLVESALVVAVLGLGLRWLVLWGLYRRGWFLRV